jgi:broad specificity phosphatase PhoE
LRTPFFLVRHAAHDNVGGFLAGRTPGIVLGKDGLAQAERLGQRMARESFDAIYASPRERTQQTAQAIARAKGIAEVTTDQRLDEIDFGAWSNRTFEDLNTQTEWMRWNTARAVAATPAGDTMFDVQARVVSLIRELHARSNGSAIVLVTHADVIKTAISYVLGLSLDAWPRFDIAPASITHFVLDDWGAKLTGLNEAGG